MKRIIKKTEWAIVDEKGNVIEKFRQRRVALDSLPRIRREYFGEKLEVVYLEN